MGAASLSFSIGRSISHMKLTLLTLGSRGDVEPFVALAVGLRRAGHVAKIVTSPKYHAWIQSYGVDVHPLRFDLVDLLRANETARKEGRKSKAKVASAKEALNDGLMQACDDYLEASQGADFVVQGGVAHGGVEIAEALNIPMAFAYLHPFMPTAAFPSFYLPLRGSLGGGYNRFTHRLALKIIWNHYGPALNRWRSQRFGLAPWQSYMEMLSARDHCGAPSLLGYSPALLPRPLDWHPGCQITGAWHLDPPPGWQPSAELTEFLERGPPPIYAGFGSMRGSDPQRLTREVLIALRDSGQRGVLLSGGGGGLVKQPAGDDVFFVDDAPHSWLFQRMAAVVHHGGAGTTANAAHAGVPSIIAPRVVDQYAWAERVQTLGIGLSPARMARLNAERLTPALRAVATDETLRRKAAEFGRVVREENGVARAVALIEAHAQDFRRRVPLLASAVR